ncbi:hypothetical protein D039_2534B, partial [Vibrio parahaemolyticus EKP-028]
VHDLRKEVAFDTV